MLIAKILGFFVREDLEQMAQALLQNVMKVVIWMEDASLQLLREQEELEGEYYKELHHLYALVALHLYQFQSQFQNLFQIQNGNVGAIVTIKLLQVLVLICLKTRIKLEEEIMSKLFIVTTSLINISKWTKRWTKLNLTFRIFLLSFIYVYNFILENLKKT